jgi:hypothetical protein
VRRALIRRADRKESARQCGLLGFIPALVRNRSLEFRRSNRDRAFVVFFSLQDRHPAPANGLDMTMPRSADNSRISNVGATVAVLSIQTLTCSAEWPQEIDMPESDDNADDDDNNTSIQQCSLRDSIVVPCSPKDQATLSGPQSARNTLEEQNTIAPIVCDGKGSRETGMVSVMLECHTVRQTLFDA